MADWIGLRDQPGPPFFFALPASVTAKNMNIYTIGYIDAW
jgi:hypothetical protein